MCIRRAANLLQNGAILNKIHQPHESHLPYLLQFLIDFNLHGMSFLHVPAEVVRYRRLPRQHEESGKQRCKTIFFLHFANTKNAFTTLASSESDQMNNQMHSIECTSVSECEIDISACHILNRLEVIDKSNEGYANPGIASLWNDERYRRSKMGGDVSTFYKS